MVPIHDTDVAAERWSKSGWENYELWEKVEVRLKRQKRLWIAATVILFVALSTVPIVMDRWPKWKARSIARHLAQEINQMKHDAIVHRSAYRIRFLQESQLQYVIESVEQCGASQGETKKTGALVREDLLSSYLLVSSKKARELGIPGLVTEFCYDFLSGNSMAVKGEAVIGLGVLPANDLSENRLDRLSVLLLSGPSAEMSFD